MLFSLLISLVFILSVNGNTISNNNIKEHDVTEYLCSICVTVYDEIYNNNNTFSSICNQFNVCDKLHNNIVNIENNSRSSCQNANICPKQEQWQLYNNNNINLDYRVSKGYGARGNDKIRISVIANNSIPGDFFTYSEQFKYRWQQYYLNTAVVDVTPGEVNTITVTDNEQISVYVPKEDEGTRGVIIADPCFQSQWIICLYQERFDTFNRITSLLNAINSHDDVHYWMILGDNFYDQDGEASGTFFSALSKETKSKLSAFVPGNHDYWVNAMPELFVPADQLGNGFMQFYGQDVAASYSAADGVTPYDFSVNLDEIKPASDTLPPLSNFFFYHQIGNVAFIGYSGAYPYEDTVPYFEEACSWAVSVDPAVVLLLGHWNGDGGDGCDSDMSVPNAFHELLDIDACAPLANKLRYVEGHKHCNLVEENGTGFMVAGMGMSGCGDFGFPVFDSVGDEFNVYYFPLQQAPIGGIDNVFDNYDAILSCIQAKGVSGCYDMATKWSTTPIASKQ